MLPGVLHFLLAKERAYERLSAGRGQRLFRLWRDFLQHRRQDKRRRIFDELYPSKRGDSLRRHADMHKLYCVVAGPHNSILALPKYGDVVLATVVRHAGQPAPDKASGMGQADDVIGYCGRYQQQDCKTL
jgi:hypothetical protein